MSNVGKAKKNQGELNPKSKLKRHQVDEIRSLHNKGANTVKELSIAFGVLDSTIRRIIKGILWK